MSKEVLSVQQLTTILSGKFKAHINNFFTIQGEVQNLTLKSHYYFNLKDNESKTSIRCILWKGTKDKNNYSLEVGDIITISGKIGLYEVQNSYSFSVFKMLKEKTKETEYQRKFEMFKKKGYFENKKKFDKKNIKRIGLITSLQGQAINDFKKTIKDRFFAGDIYLYDVKVQGVCCAKEVINAVNTFEKSKKYNVDTILITRGGGSTIDMDEFNNEALIERIHKCKKIIMCAIGHEADMCLLDYVCDLRSSTPTSLALEVSVDYNTIDNTMRNIFEKERNQFKHNINDLILKINEKKGILYQKLLDHRSNGFYFNEMYITNIEQFQKLCNEKFKIFLEDGVIEFKINNYKVIEKFNKNHTYKKYIAIYNTNYSKIIISEKEINNFEKYYNNFIKLEKTDKFGTKPHYELFKKLIQQITYYVNELKDLDEITKEKEDYQIKEGNELTYNYLLNYKKHLNFLDKTFNNNFENIKIKKDKTIDVNKLYNQYLKYDSKKGITKELIIYYKRLKNMNIKYYKIKKKV